MKDKLLSIVESLQPEFGEISSRRMFGGIGIFSHNVMFAIIDRDTLHIRSSERQCKLFESQNIERFKCRNYSASISSCYYSLDMSIVNDKALLLEYFEESRASAVQYREDKLKITSERLKYLPNLTGSTERLLERAGINTVSELKSVGAVNAYHAIQSIKDDVGVKLMWNIEGAINGVHWSVVTMARREELKEEFHQLLDASL
ncbi:TfoX/Sxy family DNA transformation protein, partial [Vibrio splendidus]